ncbi:MAG TPA: DUF3574 domain-containing protein [Pyrinomonadaceae bacterium]|nr:DUF3574 domain-containing protein [Pyrinomonadaceae bacterium]
MRNRILIAIGFVIVFGINVPAQQSGTAAAPAAVVRAENYYRTELYMGMSIPGGSIVSDEAWEKFLSDFVTPLFPDGFSILGGRGQYREASGTIAKEPSHVLVFLYKKADRKAAGSKIEQIRAEYKKRFSQESVLRVDITKSVLVSF